MPDAKEESECQVHHHHQKRNQNSTPSPKKTHIHRILFVNECVVLKGNQRAVPPKFHTAEWKNENGLGTGSSELIEAHCVCHSTSEGHARPSDAEGWRLEAARQRPKGAGRTQ